MGDKENKNTISGNDVINLISVDNFANLSDEMKKLALNSVGNKDEDNGGIMGNFFGSKKELAAMNIVLVICAMLLLLCIIDMVCALFQGRSAYTELTKNVFPIISLAIGYLLGKGKE